MIDETREKIAALISLQWRLYMGYHLDKCEKVGDQIVVPTAYYDALRRQIATPYADLSEEEKDLDRREADKVLALISAGE